MAITINTSTLQDMVSRAVKGASNNKMIPLTSLMALDLNDHTLRITTTDATNYLEIIQEKIISDESLYVVIDADKFNKLVSKISSETISLQLAEQGLEVIGNGKYLFDLPLDEEGKPIRFPNYQFEINQGAGSVVKLSTVKLITSVNKASLANTMEIPAFTGYYFGDMVLTTNIHTICHTAIRVFDQKMLLPSELVNLLLVMVDEDIRVFQEESRIKFSTNGCVIYGYAMDGIDDFKVDQIDGLIKMEFPSMCKLPRHEFIAVLDRLSLFMTQQDKDELIGIFTPDGMRISCKGGTGSELIKYQGSENFKSFTVRLDIELVKSVVASQSGEVLEVWYGSDLALKFVHGQVTQIVALLEDEEMSEEGPGMTETDSE